MKKITMFYLPTCPHCAKAFELVNELQAEHPELADLQIETIDEKAQSELANTYDYYYVPTYYVEDEKLHEGVPSKEKIEAVLRAALP